jgi:hypothetical protein
MRISPPSSQRIRHEQSGADPEEAIVRLAEPAPDDGVVRVCVTEGWSLVVPGTGMAIIDWLEPKE